MIPTVDTNLLVYTRDVRDPEKHRSANTVLDAFVRTRGAKICVQVLAEYYSVLTRKLKEEPLPARDAAVALSEAVGSFSYDIEDMRAALELAANRVLWVWDGVLVCAALRAGCTLLISEDLQSGRQFDQLSVISPFAPDGSPNPNLMKMFEASQ